MQKICFTGYRPDKLPFKCGGGDAGYLRFMQKAQALLMEYAQNGAYFMTGMAQGSDIILAGIVLSLRDSGCPVQLEAVMPFPGQARGWNPHDRNAHADILRRCDKVTVVSDSYSPGSYMLRNRYMVDNSELVIAVYEGKSGGTKNTLNYAFKKGRKTLIINPSSLHSIKLDMLI